MSLEKKLNPPQLAPKLPACAGNTIQIPFALNKSVSPKDFNKIAILIKTVQSNVIKLQHITTNYFLNKEEQLYVVSLDLNEYNDQFYTVASTYTEGKSYYIKNLQGTYSKVTLSEEDFSSGQYYELNENLAFFPTVGLYYKIQLAFVNKIDNSCGYYSPVGVMKYTSEPTLTISNLANSKAHAYSYTGVYTQNDDITEKCYSYHFNLYDENNTLVSTSGELLHNHSEDSEINQSTDTWTIRKTLEPNVNYEIQYGVTTINGLKRESQRFSIIESETVTPNIHASLSAENVFEDGYIKINLIGDNSGALVNGKFILLRSSSDEGFENWYELTRFDLSHWDSKTIKTLCKDYTTKQGVSYRYAIRAYNSAGLLSNRLENIQGSVYSDFEDIFLFDGERQLKIKFNPKVSSFKTNILESKIETLGGKYPFVFRNGNVNYKELSISGLISLCGDENNEFSRDFEADCISGHLLTSDNMYKEREFKTQVHEWLTNGQPKLFRSAAEGNFIVRLMNISLTPTDSLGRMLHTFTATAYEIAENTFDSLRSLGLLMDDYLETRTLKMNQINLNTPPEEMVEGDCIVLPGAVYASVSATPYTTFGYKCEDSDAFIPISIGATGMYLFQENALLSSPLIAIKLLSNTWGDNATLTYGYYDQTVDTFSIVYNIQLHDRMTQLIGKGLEKANNLIAPLTDLRLTTGAFHYIKVQPRERIRIYRKEGEYYYNNSGSRVNKLNPICLYYIYDYDNPEVLTGEYLDGQAGSVQMATPKPIKSINYDFSISGISSGKPIYFNGTAQTTGRYEALRNLSSIAEMYAGNGLVLDVVYQEKEFIYIVEVPESNFWSATVNNLKQQWQNVNAVYQSLLASESNQVIIDQQKEQVDIAYKNYLDALRQAVDAVQKEYGVEYAL